MIFSEYAGLRAPSEEGRLPAGETWWDFDLDFAESAKGLKTYSPNGGEFNGDFHPMVSNA